MIDGMPIDTIRGMPRYVRYLIREMLITAFDHEMPRKMRRKKLNKFLKTLNVKEQKLASTFFPYYVSAKLELGSIYPLVIKKLMTMVMDLTCDENFIYGSRRTQRQMMWKYNTSAGVIIDAAKRLQKSRARPAVSFDQFLSRKR